MTGRQIVMEENTYFAHIFEVSKNVNNLGKVITLASKTRYLPNYQLNYDHTKVLPQGSVQALKLTTELENLT